MEITNISQVCIKPSSPTPNHLKNHKLSLFDQMYVPYSYVSMVFFYPMKQDASPVDQYNDGISKRSLLLKESLAKTLTRFYPFAGKISDDFSIDCDDEGAYYVEARANSTLGEYLENPDLTSLHIFLPHEDGRIVTNPGFHVAMIKETTFACAGIAFGISVSHTIADGITLYSFLKDWSAMARMSGEEIVSLNFDAPTIFPAIEPFPREAKVNSFFAPFLKKGKIAKRRFVFYEEAVAYLKAEVSNSGVENPSRVEAVSAFLCKKIRAVFEARSCAPQPTLIAHRVNMRRRANPPLPESSVGNFLYMARALCTTEETELCDLVRRTRQAIGRLDGDFVNGLQVDGRLEKLCEPIKEMDAALKDQNVSTSEVNLIGFSSWCNIGIYDINFGWGKPLWVALAGPKDSEGPYMNMLLLMDTRTGGGVEAWLALDEKDIAIFEKDTDLLKLVTVHPSPRKFLHA